MTLRTYFTSNSKSPRFILFFHKDKGSPQILIHFFRDPLSLLSPLFFDLAPKRETGGPQGRLFHSALFDTTVFSIVFLFFRFPPTQATPSRRNLINCSLKEEDEKREERID